MTSQPTSGRPRPEYERHAEGGPQPSADSFLPTTREEMRARGWDRLDVLLVSGDAYVDHPAFGVALLGRLLEERGYRVGVVAQPRWDSPRDIARLGAPRLFCGVSAGCLDSMLAHYTAFRKKRSDDAYTPGGRAGRRPNRACIVYANLARSAFPGVPVVLGGIEASLRRAVHYDFWSDSIRRSILLDSKADLLLYGMSERSIVEVADRLDAGRDLTGIAGSVYATSEPPEGMRLPTYGEIQAGPRALLEATLAIEAQVHRGSGALIQEHGDRAVIIMPPADPLAEVELDRLYALPFTREAHPCYSEPIPALDMVRWSITAVRGCGGGCTFCSLALHQGRHVRSRSVQSVLDEARLMSQHPLWKGTITDVGGPTANLWGASCRIEPGACRRPSCLSPTVCPNLHLHQRGYVDLLRRIKALAGVKHVRVSSGIRHDAALTDERFVRDLVAEFVGGQLKLAPEHTVGHVLEGMRKSGFESFERFLTLFARVNREAGKEQYIVPYVMSAFPGCTLEDMKTLARWFRSQGWQPQQIQCFIPTPGTVATAMYHAECDTAGRPIHVAKSDREREDQHAVLVPDRGRRKRRGKRADGKTGRADR